MKTFEPSTTPAPDCLLMVGDRGDRSGDLGGVGRQGSDHAEAGFGEPEALTDPLEPGDQHPTRAQTDNRPNDEDRDFGPTVTPAQIRSSRTTPRARA